ncbi:MAG: hypothetical protein FJX76_01875, partial [Armatimonadetes bacterium]|nr:hypothetical protein [Armatimonadota bacterium]
SGKAFLQASDNPTEAVQALQGRQMINVNEQYQKSLTLANGWVTYTDQNLDTVIKGLQDARQEVVQVSNDVTFAPGSQQREASAKAINAILEEMLGYANAQYEGR